MSSEKTERWTAERIAALPEGALFDRREEIMEGRKVFIPVMRQVVAIWLEDDDVKSYVDDDGVMWSLCRYADGNYFRRRVGATS